MDSIVHFFEQISPVTRAIILAGGLVLFWIIEGIVPLFRLRYRRYQHAGLNLFFTFTTVVVNFAFALLIVAGSRWAVDNQFGLLYLFEMPVWLFVLIGLLVMDLISAYWIHYIQHKVKWMWKFHLVHHTDVWVDTTTANRHHPGESVFRAAFTLLAVMVVGAPMWLVFLYQSLSAGFSQFNHANMRFPKGLDRVLSWVIVSPNMHKVHHHYAQPLTDTNYGNIFSIWDRLFGTFAYVPDMNTLHYGIDTHPLEKEHNHIGNLLKMPFQEYRAPKGSKFADSSPKPEN
jgi:sterol desaturase/sphingolipid hydroxylase (fatty acid hydroxylase superfamily)